MRRATRDASNTHAVLLAAALLLSCAGSSLPSARAAATSPAGPAASPSCSTAAATRRRSGWLQARNDGEQQQQQLPPLTTAAAPRGRGGAAPSPAWFVARKSRGGGIFRRRRGGSVGAGSRPGAGDKLEGGEGNGRGADRKQRGISEGYTVATGTFGGAGDGDGDGSSSAEEEEGSTSDGGEEGGSESNGEDDENASNTRGCSNMNPPAPRPSRDSAVAAQDAASRGAPTDEDDGSRESTNDDSPEEGEEATEDGSGAEEEEGTAGGGEEGEGAAAATEERRRPVAPLFSFPPGPRVHRTEAEENLQEVLPMQQRLVKYLTEDRVFGAQILCSIYFFMSAVAYSVDNVKFRGCYQAALAALTLKQWGTVLGRVRRVLVPHLLYEPQRYVKYRARVSALALDPAVQGIVYCAIFMLMPLGHALLPLLVKESVYLLWVVKEVLQIAAPGLVETMISLFEPLMSVLMTAGDGEKWRGTPPGEKRLLLGRRLAQVCFKLEMMLPFSVALRVLPVAIQASLVAGGEAAAVAAGAAGSAEQGEGGAGAAAAAAALEAMGAEGASGGGGLYGQLARTLPLIKVGMLMMAYVKLLTVKNGQLEDDVRILRGLKIRGYNMEWVEQAADSVVFGKMVGCPWWAGLLASAFAVLPNHEATKTVMASDDKLKTFGMTMLNLAIGRKPGVEDDDDDEDEAEKEDAGGAGSRNGEEASPPSRLAKMAKVAAVATGISDF